MVGARIVMLIMIVPMILVILVYDTHPVLLFAAMPLILIVAFAGDRIWRKRTRWLRPARRCEKCGYALAGLAEEGKCPECGQRFWKPGVEHVPMRGERK